MFTSKDLKKLIIPLIFEQLLAVSVGFVDTFMVSIAGEAAVSGVALVDNISNLLIQILSALATGGAVVCSQYLGSRNINMSKKSAGQLIFIMSTLSSLLMVISLIGNHGIINFIFGKIEKDVFESASIYFYITAISYPFLGVYNAGAALFRSIGNSKISMNTSLIMNIINICGNALFIFVFNMGVAGVALATLISRIISAIIIIALMFKAESAIRIKSGRDFMPFYYQEDSFNWSSERIGKRHVPDRKALCFKPCINIWHCCHRRQLSCQLSYNVCQYSG